MITLVTGDIFDAKLQCLVCPVNCEGVTGSGLPRMFDLNYPVAMREYRRECSDGRYFPGRVTLHWVDDDVAVACMATKDTWKRPSKLQYVKRGLLALREEIEKHELKSVAIPALGCGLGKLRWTDVEPLIRTTFEGMDQLVVDIYTPE